MIDYRLYKLPKGTAANVSFDGRQSHFCGLVHYGDRRKAAGNSFMTAVNMAKRSGVAVSDAEVFDILNVILHGAPVWTVRP